MSNPPVNDSPLLTRDECEAMLSKCCISAMRAFKFIDKTNYFAEIDSLSKISHNLITHYQESPYAIIERMERIMANAHDNELTEIDNKIKYLFNVRKQTPANSLYCEHQIIKLTTEISILEKRKLMPVKDTIQSIICDTLHRAIKVLGTEVPTHFCLTQYEYHPRGAGEPDHPIDDRNVHPNPGPGL